MGLESLLKKYLPLVFSATLSCQTLPHQEVPSLSLRHQQQVPLILDELNQDIPLLFGISTLATGFSNISRASERESNDFSKKEFIIGAHTSYTTLVKGLLWQGKKENPLLIVEPGYLADSLGHPSHNMMKILQDSPLKDYNVLFLDHSTSAQFLCDNGNASWGGVEEGYLLEQITEQMQVEGYKNITLLGISMGGTGVMHALYRNPTLYISGLVFSPVTDYTDVPGNSLRELSEHSNFGKNYFTFQGLINSIGLKELISGFYETIEKDEACAKKYQDRTLEDLFWNTKRYENKELLEKIFEPYLHDHLVPHLPHSVPEYLTFCDTNRIAEAIKKPLYVLHAHDDAVVLNHHFYRFMLAGHENNFISGTILADGGHWGFSSAYGRNWIGCVIKTYVDFWSKEEFSIDNHCL